MPPKDIPDQEQDEKIQSLEQNDYPEILEASILKATLESTADGILVVNRSGNILTYNQKLEKCGVFPRT